jgi:hypothetical protein
MTDKAISPLRRRMIEDMTIRKLAPKTQASYIRAVRDFRSGLFFGTRFDVRSRATPRVQPTSARGGRKASGSIPTRVRAPEYSEGWVHASAPGTRRNQAGQERDRGHEIDNRQRVMARGDHEKHDPPDAETL